MCEVIMERSQSIGDFDEYINWNLRQWSNPQFDNPLMILIKYS
jgi:hypothetical protein